MQFSEILNTNNNNDDEIELELGQESEEEEIDDSGWSTDTTKFFGLNSRSVSISGEIDQSNATAVISQLLEITSYYPDEAIRIFINTPGGDIVAALAVYDTLRMISNPIITIAMGECSSAGLVLLMAGDIRLSTEHASFFYHSLIHTNFVAHPIDITENHNYYFTLTEKVNNILRTRSGLNNKLWNSNYGPTTTKYFTAEQALEHHFIHKIIKPEPKDKKQLKALRDEIL